MEVCVPLSFPHHFLTIFIPVTKEVCLTTNHISNGACLCIVLSGKPRSQKAIWAARERSNGSNERLSRLGKAAASLSLPKELTSGRDSGRRLLLMPYFKHVIHVSMHPMIQYLGILIRFLRNIVHVWNAGRRCVIQNSLPLV